MSGCVTGVAITDRYIVSCAHGIEESRARILCRRVYEKGVWYDLIVAHIRIDWDLSLLEFESKRPKGRLDFLSISEDETLSPFDVLFLEGNPGGNPGSFFKLRVVFPCKKISFASFRRRLTCEEHFVDRRIGGSRYRTLGDIYKAREEDNEDEHFDKEEEEDGHDFDELEDNDVPMTREEHGDDRGRRHRTMGDIYNEETIPLSGDGDDDDEEDGPRGAKHNRNVPIIICSGISSSGASGGPLFTENGDVIGIHVAGSSTGDLIAIHASALNALLAEATVIIPLGPPSFEELQEGGCECIETGHMLPNKEAINSYVDSKRFRMSFIDAILPKNKPPLNFFRHSPDGVNLICKVTGDIIQKSAEHISKHINGRRFLDKLADDTGVKSNQGITIQKNGSSRKRKKKEKEENERS